MQKPFKGVIQKLKDFRQDRVDGKFNSIPVPFPRFAKIFPGWERGIYTIMTANSGVGKTKLTKFMIATSILKFAADHPQIKVRIRWYALEEGEDEFALSFISTILQLKYGISIDVPGLKSLGAHPVSDDVMKKIDAVTAFMDTFMEPLEIIDDIYNPYGIWKDVRQFAADNGKFYFEGVEVFPATKNGKTLWPKWDVYTPNDPKEFVFIVNDNINNLHGENGGTLREAMTKYSKQYCLEYMKKKLNYHVINVQQQAAEKEKQEYNYKGYSISQKLEPSLDGLGDNKTTARDADLVLGMFSPTRYSINEFEGYDITKLGDSFRALKILKDRNYGTANKRAFLYFDGATNTMVELPRAREMTEDIYKKYGK
jgi:hypothetical protein